MGGGQRRLGAEEGEVSKQERESNCEVKRWLHSSQRWVLHCSGPRHQERGRRKREENSRGRPVRRGRATLGGGGGAKEEVRVAVGGRAGSHSTMRSSWLPEVTRNHLLGRAPPLPAEAPPPSPATRPGRTGGGGASLSLSSRRAAPRRAPPRAAPQEGDPRTPGTAPFREHLAPPRPARRAADTPGGQPDGFRGQRKRGRGALAGRSARPPAPRLRRRRAAILAARGGPGRAGRPAIGRPGRK